MSPKHRRSLRRYRSNLASKRRICQIRNESWGSKGKFGWDATPQLDTIKQKIIKKAKTRHPYANDGGKHHDHYYWEGSSRKSFRGDFEDLDSGETPEPSDRQQWEEERDRQFLNDLYDSFSNDDWDDLLGTSYKSVGLTEEQDEEQCSAYDELDDSWRIIWKRSNLTPFP